MAELIDFFLTAINQEAPVTLDDALRPMPLAHFRDSVMGSMYVLIEGSSNRFSQLADWSALNTCLNQLRVSGSRLRLFRCGRPLPAHQYLAGVDEAHGAYLDSFRVMEALAGGATLVVNQVDELFASVRELAEDSERHYHVPVGVNLYASWKSDSGFDLHWDNHDAVVFQLTGRKHWTIYGPTFASFVEGTRRSPSPPTSQPVWRGFVNAGSLLYVPRGWWHLAAPCDEPSLHLTLGIRRRTAYDLARWLINELEFCADLQTPIPLSTNRERLLNDVRAVMDKALSAQAVDRFMEAVNVGIKTRPTFALPALTSSPLCPESSLSLANDCATHDGSGRARLSWSG